MSKLTREIEARGTYCKVKITGADVTGMLVAENYRYDPHSNTGGRRYIGNMADLARDYGMESSMAAQALGSMKSPRKAASSRANGLKGGRPQKSITQQMVKAVKAHSRIAWHDAEWWVFEKLDTTTCIKCAIAACGKGASIKDIAEEAVKGIVSID